MKVERITIPEEVTDASIKQYLANCASVVRNAQPRDNDRLFARLMKESFGGKPSRMFEFIPCVLPQDWNGGNPFKVTQQFFGFFEVDQNENPLYYYTNARELLNWGFSWEEVLPHIDFTEYRAVKVTAPYFIYGQLSTHTQITSVSHSNRYTESGLGYWMPEEVARYFFDEYDMDSETAQKNWDCQVTTQPPALLQTFMKVEASITRREVYARGSDMLQYRVFSLGGYQNNPNAWPHFINQRLRDPHTQKETREVAALIEGVTRD